jgi:hypothetical protein
MTKLWSSLILVVAVLAVAILAQTSAGHALMRGMGLTRDAPGYTQLSFAHPESLPADLTPKAALRVPFEIHNSSASAHTYQWTITLARGRTSQRLASGQVRAAAGQTVTVSRAVAVSCPSGRVRLDFGVTSPRELIDFYATCAGSTT